MKLIPTEKNFNALHIPAMEGILGIVDRPTDDHMEAINFFTPVGSRELTPDDVFVANVLAVDSTINWRQEYYGNMLETVASTNRGIPFMIDHRSSTVESINGSVFDTALFEFDRGDIPDRMFQQVEMTEWNEAIASDLGNAYRAVVLSVFFQKQFSGMENALRDAFSYRRVYDMSISGTIFDLDSICPLNGLSFWDPENPYYPPWMAWWLEGTEDEEWVAPYEVIEGRWSAYENSLVVAGCFANASTPIKGNETGEPPSVLATVA